MKKACLLIILFIAFTACEGTDEESKPNHSVQEEKKIIDQITIETDSIVTSTVAVIEKELIPNDWDKMQLKGKVKSLKTYGDMLEADGSSMGMDGGSTYIYFFDTSGFIQSAKIYGLMGRFSESKIDYIYNEDDILTHRILFHAEDMYDENDTTFWEKEKYFYNENNQLVKIKTAGVDHVLTKETEFKYFENGKLKSKIDFNGNGEELNHEEFQYGMLFRKLTKSNLVMEADYSKDSLVINYTSFYPDYNEYSEAKVEYDFDKKGNWIKSVDMVRYKEEGKFTDWEIQYGEFQEIEYFE